MQQQAFVKRASPRPAVGIQRPRPLAGLGKVQGRGKEGVEEKRERMKNMYPHLAFTHIKKSWITQHLYTSQYVGKDFSYK